MQTLRVLPLAVLLSLSLTLAACGTREKPDRSLGRARQGQNGGGDDNGGGGNGGGGGGDLSPAEKLKKFCESKKGELVNNNGICMYTFAKYTPKDEELANLDEEKKVILFNAPRETATFATRSTGVVMIWDQTRQRTFKTVNDQPAWQAIPDGEYYVRVMPRSATGVQIFVRACIDQNSNYMPCVGY